jgi:hypothetical protein
MMRMSSVHLLLLVTTLWIEDEEATHFIQYKPIQWNCIGREPVIQLTNPAFLSVLVFVGVVSFFTSFHESDLSNRE